MPMGPRREKRKKTHIWLGAPKGGAVPPAELTYLLHDEFTTDEAAPIASPRTCEPGPGTLVMEQVDGTTEIVGSELSQIGGSVGWGNVGFHMQGGVPRQAGIAMLDHATPTDSNAYISQFRKATAGGAATASDCSERSLGAGGLTWYQGSIGSPTFPLLNVRTEFYKHLSILRETQAAFLVINGKLFWPSVDPVQNTATLYPGNSTFSSEIITQDFSVLDLVANGYPKWDADFSTITDGPTEHSADSLYDCDADCMVEVDFTQQAVFSRIFARFLDGANTLRITIDAGGGIVLSEVGGAGNIASQGGVVSAGVAYNLKWVLDGSSIKVYIDNGLLFDVTSTYLQDQTGGFVDVDVLVPLTVASYKHPALGIATSHTIAPQPNVDFSMISDALVVIRDLVLPASDDNIFIMRQTTVDDWIELGIDSAGAGQVIEFVNGSGTSKMTFAASTFTDGDDVLIVMDGTYLEVIRNTTSLDTATIANISPVSCTGQFQPIGETPPDSIECWPRDVTSLLPPELT